MMVAIETTSRHQDTVLWPFASFDRNGEPRVSAPVDFKTRWEQGLMESVTQDATPIAINGTIFVDRDIEPGSILRLGTVAGLPTPVTGGLMIVESFDKIPDIKARKYQRTAMVRVYKDTLPEVV